MIQLLNQIVTAVALLTTQFFEEHVNGLVVELIKCIPNGIDLILYSDKEEYPYVEQDGCKLEFGFSLNLQKMKKLLTELNQNYGFQVRYLRVLLPEKKLQLGVRFNADASDLIEAGWDIFPSGDDEMDIYMKI